MSVLCVCLPAPPLPPLSSRLPHLQYPAAMQFAKLQTAVGGAFVPPDGALNDTAVAELAALAPAVAGPDADWSFVNIRCPSVYPVCYWGLATLAADLTPQGDRGLYIRDTGAWQHVAHTAAASASEQRRLHAGKGLYLCCWAGSAH